MVLNPYKANESRSRIIDPYYSTSSSGTGLHKSFLTGCFSTRNMIILLLVCIAFVSYIFHIHHNIAVDSNNNMEITEAKLRGTTTKSNSNANNRVESIVSSPSPTWKPTFAPSYMPTPRPTTLEPTLSPTTLTPTQTPTRQSVATEKPTIAQTVVDLRKEISSTTNLAAHELPKIVNKDTLILSPNNDPSKQLVTDSEPAINPGGSMSNSDSNSNSVVTKSPYLSLLESMKNRPSLQQVHQPPSPKSDSLHTEEKSQFFPPHRPSEIPLSPGNLQVPPKTATTSDGMIPFDPSVLKKIPVNKDLGVNEEFENRDVNVDSVEEALLQSPNRMKYDLPPAIQQAVGAKQTSTGAASTEKIDHCKSQIDPFQSQPVESFVPPANAPFSKVLEWQTEVKNVLKNIGKMRIGGDKLRLYMQEEVNRLRVKRFNAFCEYVE